MMKLFSGKQGQGVIAGLVLIVLSFVTEVLNAGKDIVSSLTGILLFVSIVSLFFAESRPYAKGFLFGFFGLFIIVALIALLVSVVLIAVHGS